MEQITPAQMIPLFLQHADTTALCLTPRFTATTVISSNKTRSVTSVCLTCSSGI